MMKELKRNRLPIALRTTVWVMVFVSFYVDWTLAQDRINDLVMSLILSVLLVSYLLDREFNHKPFSVRFYPIIGIMFTLSWLIESYGHLVQGIPRLVLGLVLVLVAYLIRPGGRFDPSPA